MGEPSMTADYRAKLKKGEEYQDFVYDLLYRFGLPCVHFSSRKLQIDRGENITGIEIKFDDRYQETGNLWIEYAEKADKKNKRFVNSGILRPDNTWLYAIGNYEMLFVLSKKHLVLLMDKERYRNIKHLRIATSKGYLLPHDMAAKYSILMFKKVENSIFSAYYDAKRILKHITIGA
jgi:hypothetical protein